MLDVIKPVKGYVDIVVRDLFGNIIQRMSAANSITIGYQTIVGNVLAQNTATAAAQNRLWAMHCGTGNTAVTTADTDLASTQFRKACTSITPAYGGTPGLIQCIMVIGSSEGNGQTYKEIGLFSRGDNDNPDLATGYNMFSRQLHAALEKNLTKTVTVTWNIQFVLAS